MRVLTCSVSSCFLVACLGCDVSAVELSEPIRLVIAHRGASGYLPEHTLAAYALAHGQGADYVELDLVRTKDGAFICLHDIYLERTTNVADVYPDRKRKDGRWYAADLSLAEVRSLEALERLPGRFPKGDSKFGVPTFEETIELVQGLNQSTGRRVGIYPELKASSFHTDEGLAMEEAFLSILRSYGFEDGATPIFVQSFEPSALRRLRELGSEYPQILLVGSRESFDGLRTDEGLREVLEYADGIGPAKPLLLSDPNMVTRAHELGLQVHPYTFRADDVPPSSDSFEDELRTFFDVIGVDGVFSDFPDRVRAFLDRR